MPSSRFHPSLYSYMRVMRQPLFFLTKDRLQDSVSFIVEEKCVTSQTSKQAILSVCTKSRVYHHTIIYRQIALYSRQLLWLWTKLHNGMILVWKKKRHLQVVAEGGTELLQLVIGSYCWG